MQRWTKLRSPWGWERVWLSEPDELNWPVSCLKFRDIWFPKWSFYSFTFLILLKNMTSVRLQLPSTMFLHIFPGSDYRVLDFLKRYRVVFLIYLFDRMWVRGHVGGAGSGERSSRLPTEHAPGVIMTWAEWATQAPLIFSYFLLACLFFNKGRTARPSAAGAGGL